MSMRPYEYLQINYCFLASSFVYFVYKVNKLQFAYSLAGLRSGQLLPKSCFYLT